MTRLIMTVGGSPLPLLRALLTLQPAHAVALATAQSAPVLDRVHHVMGEIAPGAVPDVEVIEVPANDLGAIQRIAAGQVAAGGDVCYAGGTWAMSTGLVRAFLDEGGAGAAWYVADDGDLLLGHRGQVMDTRPAMAAAPLDLRQMLQLHGSLPEGWRDIPPVAPAEDPRDLYRALEGMPIATSGEESAGRSRDLVHHVLTAVATLVGDAGSVYPESRIALRARGRERTEPLPPLLVSGGRLTVLAIPGYTRDQRIRSAKPFTRQTKLGTLKESLYAAEFLAVRAGGVHARAVAIATDPRSDGGSAALRLDMGPDTVPDPIDPAEPGNRGEPVARLAAFPYSDLLVGLSNKVINLGLVAPITAWLLGENE